MRREAGDHQIESAAAKCTEWRAAGLFILIRIGTTVPTRF
jgi:hypothetical protein